MGFRLNFSGILSLLLLVTASQLSAQTIPISSYTYLKTPSGLYPDSGAELTDGMSSFVVWPHPDVALMITALVGWQDAEGKIRFNFSEEVTIRSATFFFADSNHAAGVVFPSRLSLTDAENTFLYDYALSDPVGSGTTVDVTVGGFEITTDHIVVIIPQVLNEQWHMLSEVRFSSSAIPEPSTYAAIAGTLGLAAVFWGRRLRR